MKLLKVGALSLLIACTTGLAVACAEPPPTDPTQDPLIIATAADLIAVSQDSSQWNRYIRVTNNIDLANTEWTSIGTDTTPFSGTFDGAGYKITSLKMTGSQFGFFGTISGTVQNVVLESFNLSATSHNATSGALAAKNNGTIKNCCASTESIGDFLFSDTITSASPTYFYTIGGLVGINTGLIQNSYFDGVVSVAFTNTSSVGQYFYVGGLVGSNTGSSAKIENSYTKGSVVVQDNDYFNASATYSITIAGGLTGLNNNGATIDRCFSSADVLSNSAFDATASGIAGETWGDSAIIKRSFSTGSLQTVGAPDAVLRAISDYQYSATIIYCYHTTEQNIYRNGTSVPAETNVPAVAESLLLSETYLTQNLNFGKYISAADLTLNPNNVWKFSANQSPTLFWQN